MQPARVETTPAPPPDGGPNRFGKANVIPRIALYGILAYIALGLIASALLNMFGVLIASAVGVFAAAALANTFSLRIYERLRLPDVGLQWTRESLNNLGIGIAGGAAAGAVTVLLPAAVGLATWNPVNNNETVGLGGFVFLTTILLFGSVGEELLFRGYGFQILVPVLGPVATLLPMSVLFAAAHADNQSVTPLGLFNTFLWGVVLGAAVLRAGDLWMSIGLHFGWNWILPLLGVNVSGFTMRLWSHALSWNVAPLWSGGDYGPEGGLFCTIVVAVIGFGVYRAPVVRQELALLARHRNDEEAA